MKKILTTVILLALAFGLAAESTLAAQSEKPFRIISKSANSMNIKFTLPEFEVSQTTFSGTSYHKISIPGTEALAEPGMPELPLISAAIAIPARGSVQIRTTNTQNSVITNFFPVPAQTGEPTENPKAMIVNDVFYSGSGSYPHDAVLYSDPAILRDLRIITFQINPFEWNAGNQVLTIRKEIDLEITFTDEPGINELPSEPQVLSSSFSKMYEANILNFNDYRSLLFANQPPVYLVIHGNTTDTAFLNKLNDFVFWKRQKGATVNVASTSVAGTSTTAIKTYIQNQYNNPVTRPDFVILIGDTSGSYTIPTFTVYSGPGDYPYTHVAGGDELGDVFIGRISVENYTQFELMVAKGMAYERNINVAQADWLNRMLLVGDWSPSGISTMYISKYIKEISTQANPDYEGGYTEIYGSDPSPTLMNNALNQGVAFYNYRGYISMSGWSPSESLINGVKMPHSIILTCGTGNFNGSTATSEAFIRLGTAASPKGALTSIGMATSSTHTTFNNCVNGGIVDGIFTNGMRTMGEGLLNGKIYTYLIYGISSLANVQKFTQWSNLMGDPTVEVFVGIPKEFTMVVEPAIPLGLSLLDINISTMGTPVEGACVTLSQGSQVLSRGYTDAEGNIILVMSDAMVAGDAVITVSKHDFKPLQQSIVVENVGTLVPGAIVIDDDNGGSSSGNTNGTINNGETIELLFGLRNTASTSINGVTGYVTTLSPYVTFLDSLVTYPDISAGEVGYNVSPAVMQVSPDTPNGTTLRLHLYLTDGASATYHVSEFIYVESPELVFTTATIVDTDNQALDPGETIDYFVTITNQGTMGASALQARLYTLNDLISVTDNYGLFGDITPGGQATSAADNFVLYAREQVLPGMVIPLQLKIFNNEGFEQYVDFSITIGVVTSTDPLGPCAYGYVIYDDTDTSYPLAPVYDWVEIAPSLGGQGTAITISDVYNSSNEGDQVGATSIATVNLPFPFQFYGRIYEQVSVCSNGFLALGVSENGEFRNYRIPGAMGPSPMIAAFWDDMATHTASGIYYWFDRNNHAFVVQWQNMKNGYNGSSEETFQIILYDQSVYSTSLGDGPIKIQYKVFNNVNAQSGNRHGNYCTIGIEDHTGTRGLEYSYNNHYPTAAAQLGNQRAIYITNIPVYYEAAQLIIGDTYVNDDNGNGVVEPGEEINLGIQLSNIGNVVADQINTTLSTDSEYVNITVSESAYFPVEAETSGVNRIPFTFVVSPNCPNGTLINFSLNITAGEYEWTRTFAIRVDASVLSYHSFLVNDYDSNFNGIIDPNETVKLVINISNNSDVEAREVVGTLLTENPFIIVAEPVKTIPIIPSNTTTQLVYGVTFDAGLTAGTLVNFSFSASCINGLPFSKDIFVPFNQADIQNDFELDNGNLMSETGWAWGTPNQVTPPSGNKLWATGLSGQYPHFVLYQLYTPVYSIVGPSQLTFQHRYGTEQSYDGGNVSISTDGGENFTILNPVGGYPNTSISGLFGEPGYSGNSSNFVTATFDLSAYQGQDVIIRFRFGSNDDIGNIGWFIDDFDVTGVSKKVGFVHGTVLPTSGMDPSLAMVKSSIGLATSPASDGLYRLYLPNGHYTATASLKHHTSSTNNQVNITQDNPLRVADFTLIDLPKPLSVGYTVNNDTGVLNIMWTEPYEPVLPVLGYKVYRKFNAGNFVMVQETTSTTYSEVLELEGRYIFYVVAKYINTDGMPSDIMSFPFPYVPGEDDVVPGLVTRLGNNYPNPFNPTTNIAFDLAQSGDVHIRIYNLKGQLVKDLVKGHQKAGRHNIIWNGKDNSNRNVSSGVYFYRMETNSYTKTMKMLLMK